uniref:CYtochrome P450 family n=1 Tax=Panagrellus redivivus TaxID=6233 RepID=A0A7E4VVZ6_PANRE
MGVFLIFSIAIAVLAFWFFYWQRRNLPPGPIPIPFYGNMYKFRFESIETLLPKWHKYYGDIMTVWMGTIPVVTIHDTKTIFETFLKDGEAYANRTEMTWNEVTKGGPFGIVFSSGALWRENRRFVLYVFRNFGLGKNIMQERVLDDVCGLIKTLKDEIASGAPEIHLFDEIDITIGSIINSIMMGYKFDRSKREEFYKVKKLAMNVVSYQKYLTFRLMMNNYKLFMHLPVFKDMYKMVSTNAEDMRGFLWGQINEHRKQVNLDADEEPTDFVEAYLRHQHKLKKEGVVGHNFHDSQLYATLLDVWVAAQETTATTLNWIFIYIIQHPEVQAKAHAELDKYISSDRIVTLDDKTNLNYINAIIAESQRVSNVVPFNVFHETTRDVEIKGYKLPKGTVCTYQIPTVLRDERYFKDPEVFRPERFLDESGKFFQPAELIPFGLGKRVCLGEGMARLELYLFTANLLNHFKLVELPGKPVEGKRCIAGTITPTPWVCGLEQRY